MAIDQNAGAKNASAVSAPAISLPKGGGAIRGIGEKFSANPVTGTGSLSVPIATSPGRSGFGPQLALTYDSGAGNGPFGFGWSLSLPAITRKTDKGLPRYQDSGANESDVFLLSGAEDLVPEFRKAADGSWARDGQGRALIDDRERDGYHVRRYRPRVEGLFASIERWTKIGDPADVHWRSITKDNLLTLYGRNENSRIANSENARQIFTWLICETRDDRGNAIRYQYQPDDGAGVDRTQAHEANRGDENDDRRKVNRYIKRIFYGNTTSFLIGAGLRPRFLEAAQVENAGWMFEVVFDYGEHDDLSPKPNDAGQWNYRSDAFSSYRSGFEIRTTRLCRRVLMFHHFPGEENVGSDCLVRSTDFTHTRSADSSSPHYAFLLSVMHTAYQRSGDGYARRSLPPLAFTYTQFSVQDAVQVLDGDSLKNLPAGLDGATYQWTDLHGEGIPGILTEQGSAWFYLRNLSPIHSQAVFAPVELVATRPAPSLSGTQIMDLAGDGLPDLVMLDRDTPGLYEHDRAEGWQPFRPFFHLPNIDLRDPNLLWVDLDGDGHVDLCFSEEDALVWHPSLGAAGFAPALRVPALLDEEQCPRLIFADAAQAVFLADMSGDGLSDLVRIRNREVCYWPNLGYGRFGRKVTLDHPPLIEGEATFQFDQPDQFDQKRIRLADIDGSGTSDIIYLHRDGVRLYFNQSGSRLSAPRILQVYPKVSDLVNIQPIDLLGNGTACLVWSSPLPGDSRRPMRYLNLMGGQKPHLLTGITNNLGAETHIQYAPSTRFYLQDRAAGTPWITHLPFPVHVVESVAVSDQWRGTTFTTRYSYHHGYFDGEEREFRGFGRVEQVDVEAYGAFLQNNHTSPYITSDRRLFQPPVKTITWYHTGAFSDRQLILSQFEQEYFPHWLQRRYPDINLAYQENLLPEPDLAGLSGAPLSAGEEREALRACKGMLLRQEVVELDVEALERTENPEEIPVKLFSSSCHNCTIRLLQPKEDNRHAVFLVAESEAVSYHYELDLRPEQIAALEPDPRIAHTLNLQIDEYANVLESVMVVYPRRAPFEADAELASGLAASLDLIHQVQNETHLAYTATQYTDDFGMQPGEAALDNRRLRVPYEVRTYQLHNLRPQQGPYFSLRELRALPVSLLPDIPYHQANPAGAGKRLVEHTRALFFAESLTGPLPLGQHGRLGLPYESYMLALTGALLDALFTDLTGHNKLDDLVDGAAPARARLDEPTQSGYLSGAALEQRFAPLPAAELAGQYWIRSGIAGFAPDAAQHFFLPEQYTDPFGGITTQAYDPRDLFLASSTDALKNTTRITQSPDGRYHFDYRVLAPRELQDLNGNLSEVLYDLLGLPAALALKGKGAEGDRLTGFSEALINPTTEELTRFFVTEAPYDEAQARAWLGSASTRYVYSLGEALVDGKRVWAASPPCACAIVREQHVSQLGPDEVSRVQAAFEYSDGLGSVVVKKIQAEPESEGQPLRWVASGKVILNNKGKPVKQYEPYFCAPEVGHHYEDPLAFGVSAVLYYDATGRLVRSELPDGSFSRLEFSPWHTRTFDANDTVRDSQWYSQRNPPDPNQILPPDASPNQRAAWLAAQHHATPTLTLLDSLGREVIQVAHNRVGNQPGALSDEHYVTFTKLDAEGKPLWMRDARGNLAMQYIQPPAPNDQLTDPAGPFAAGYDLAGSILFQHSMDAGERWVLNDAAGSPMLAWDGMGRLFFTEYDALHRPTGQFVKGADPQNISRVIQFEQLVYGDTPGSGLSSAPENDETRRFNLRGQIYRHGDSAGLVTNLGANPLTGTQEAFDFKGNRLRSTRRLAVDYKTPPDWSQAPALEAESYTSSTRYDALNRPMQVIAPHSSAPGARFNVLQPGYNASNLLEQVHLWEKQTAEPAQLLNSASASLQAVRNIDYDAKGQRTRIEYNQGSHPIVTEYTYDLLTFRLVGLHTTRPLHPDPTQRKLQDLTYTYDPTGNITAIHDDAQQPAFFDNVSVPAGCLYTYDALYRLVRAEGREHAAQNNPQRDAAGFAPIFDVPFPNSPEALQRYTETYEYDPTGNLLGLRHAGGAAERWVRWYQYALDSNRLLATRAPGEAGQLPFYAAQPGYQMRYTYDVHGSITSMPHLPVMQWDFRDQLQASAQQARNDGGKPEITYYVYDSAGQRVRKVTERQSAPGETSTRKKERTYLGAFELYREYGPDGESVTLARETLHVMDDRRRIALIETRTDTPVLQRLARYQLDNHLGSAVLEIDDQAQVISYEEYHPYGTTAYQAARSQTETPRRYRFTGKERDEETQFSYHGIRYYAPWLGRWVSADPAAVAGAAKTNHAYAYVQGKVIVRIDSQGLDDEPATFGQGAAKGAKEMGEGALLGTGDLALRTTGLVGAPKSDSDRYYEALSKGEYSKAAKIWAEMQVKDSAVSHVVKGAFGLVKSTGESAGDLAYHVIHGEGNKAGYDLVKVVIGGVLIYLSIRGSVKGKPKAAQMGETPPKSTPPPAPAAPEPAAAAPKTAVVDQPGFPAPETKPQPKPVDAAPPSQPAEPATAGGAKASSFGNWTLADVMRGSSFKSTQKIIYRGAVERMAQAMKDKTFKWEGMEDPIIVDSQGNILQGHHRIVAARLSRTPIPESAIKRLPGESVRDARPWADHVTLKPGDKPM